MQDTQKQGKGKQKEVNQLDKIKDIEAENASILTRLSPNNYPPMKISY